MRLGVFFKFSQDAQKTIQYWLVNQELVKPLLPRVWRIGLLQVMCQTISKTGKFLRSIWAHWSLVTNLRGSLKSDSKVLSKRWCKAPVISFYLSTKSIHLLAQVVVMVLWTLPISSNLRLLEVSYVPLGLQH